MTPKITAWHTANAGVVLYIEGKHGIGFDAFARDPKGLYSDTPDQVRQRLFGEVAAGCVETLVFTHEHPDHFRLEDALEALRYNPRLRIISTEEVIRQLREKEAEAGRLTAVPASEQKYRVVDLSDMRLTLFNSTHMGDQFADIQNLVCLLEAGGMHLMLPGDAKPTRMMYEKAAAWEKEIDWLIGPFPLLGLPSSRRLISRYLTLKQVLAMHLPRPEKDAEGWRKNTERLCKTAADGLPVPILGDEIGKYYEF